MSGFAVVEEALKYVEANPTPFEKLCATQNSAKVVRVKEPAKEAKVKELE